MLWAFVAQITLVQTAGAQYWASYEVCKVDNLSLHSDAVAPATLEDILSQGRQIPNGQGKFWEVTAPNEAVSYLWGTIHVNDPIITKLPDHIRGLISQSRLVALEIDPIFKSRRELELAQQHDKSFRPTRRGGDLDLGQNIDPRILDWIKSRLHGLGWTRQATDYLNLAGISELLLYDPCNDFSVGTYPSQDSYIQLLGAHAGAKILALESVDRIFETMNKPKNKELAYDMIELYGAGLNPAQTARDRTTFFALYLQGQIGAMMAWERSDMNTLLGAPKGAELIARVDEYLLDERNETFVANLQKELEIGGVFCAVGSYHLPGANGMIAMLRRAGYKVERVPLDGEVRN